MKKFFQKGAVKALSALLIAGMLSGTTGVDAYAFQYNGVEFDDETFNMVVYNPAYDLNGDGVVTFEEYQEALLKIQAAQQEAAQHAAAQQAAAEEAARQQAAAEEAARQQAAAEEAARQQAAAAEAARQQAAAEEAARQKAAAEEAARQQAAAEEAARQKAAAEEAARQQAAAEEAARQQAEAAKKAAEEAAKVVKRDTPNVGKNLLNGKGFTNVPDNSVIWMDGSKELLVTTAGNYTLPNDSYERLCGLVRYSVFMDVYVKAVARNAQELDSDVQTIRVTFEDIPAAPKTKRSTPNAGFEASTSTLSNMDCAKYSLDGGNTWSTDIVGSTVIQGVHPDLEIRVKNSARTDDEIDSDIQTIWITKANAPVGVTAHAATTIGGKGSIVNVSTDEEYRASGAANWNAIGGNTIPNLAPGSYDVRVKAHGTMLASDYVTVTVANNEGKKADKPNAQFDGARLNLYNINVGCAYTVDDYNWVLITDSACTNVTLTRDAVEKAVHGNGIRIKRVGDGAKTIDSDIQTISIAEAVKPSGLATTPATSGNNGTIKNVASDMQYTADNINWFNIEGNVVKNLGAGKYYVRRKGSGTTIPSEAVAVTVSKSDPTPAPSGKMSTPSASFNAWNMTLSDVYGCRYSLDGGYGFSATITDKNEVCLSEGDIKVGNGIIVVRSGDKNNRDSDAQKITLTKQGVPSGISAVSATATIGGMITGLNSGMEYRAANSGTWVTPTGNTAVNLPVGTYYVRTKGAHTAMPSDCLAVVIQLSSTTTIAPATQTVVVPSTTTKTEDKKTTTDTTKTEAKSDAKAEVKTETNTDTASKTENTDAAAAETAETSSDTTAPTPAGSEPVLIGDSSVAGWAAIEEKMSTEPVAVDLTHAASTLVPADAFAAAANSGTELIIDVSPDMAWSINGGDIATTGQDIDLGIDETSSNIPTDVIVTIENEGSVQKQFTVKHEGDFGFTANLTVKLNSADAGKTAKLYYYNTSTNAMELVDYAIINNYGEATFAMTHASSYAVCVNTAVAAADNSSSDSSNSSASSTTSGDRVSSKKTKKSSNAWIWIIVVAVIVTGAACGLIVYLKKKEEEERRRRHRASSNGADRNNTQRK